MDINCEDMEDGTCRVTYCPTEPGSYVVNIKFAEKHIPGSTLLLQEYKKISYEKRVFLVDCACVCALQEVLSQ